MSIDLSQFHQVFFEESFEGLDDMEAALMELDPNNIDDETINAIFRAAHSIKGGSATFGFSSVAEFTHDLETILDQVRSGTRSVDNDDINLFLKSVDCMREMLSSLQKGDDGVTELSGELQQRFRELLAAGTSASVEKASATDIVSSSSEDEVQCTEQLWSIQFIPSADILKTGNEPLRFFSQFAEMGEIQGLEFNSDSLDLHSMDAENCYLSWNIKLKSKCSKEDIEEVFEWVSDDSDIDINNETGMQSDASAWSIGFVPDKNILRTGNEPTRLFRVLGEMGDIQVRPVYDHLPSMSELDHELCYLSWHIVLAAPQSAENDIKEIFEWVEDLADIHIEYKSASVSSEESGDNQGVESDAVNQPNADTASVSSNDEQAAKDAGSSTTIQTEDVSKPKVNASNNDNAPKKEKARTKIDAQKKAAEGTSIRVGIDKIDNLINMVGELVITQSMLGQLGTDFELEQVPKLLEGLGQLEQNTRELQESVMRIRMLPISFAFSRFPRMIRDLSQTLGKSVNLVMHGEHTELDKTVMEKIGDPMVHLVRNAVDHGIETPEERLAKGKPETGSVTLEAYHQSGNVVIEIVDDGKGLDPAVLVEKSIEKGILSENEAAMLTKEQSFDLIFRPGFSTAKTISDVSGRGVGMDVVKRNIQALNGSVDVTSEKDKGSKFTIRLPLTLAILDGQLVRVGSQTYIFPLVSIVESLQCKKEFINRVAGGCDVFRLRDDYVPIIELHKVFDVEPDTTELEKSLMVVVESDGEKVGIVVDELLAQQQVVIKSLEQNYKRVEGISGATILGDGTVSLIIDIPGVVNIAGAAFVQADLPEPQVMQANIQSNMNQVAVR